MIRPEPAGGNIAHPRPRGKLYHADGLRACARRVERLHWKSAGRRSGVARGLHQTLKLRKAFFMKAEILWHGHANFQITSGGLNVLVDPFFTDNPVCAVSWEQAPKADVVLVTHDHGDHVGDAVAVCCRHGALCCAVFETAFALVERGLPQELIGAAPNIGGTVEVRGARITLTPALHTSGTGAPLGYVVRMPGGFTFYHSGDTALFSDMSLIGQEHELDLALLPIGDVYTMNPAQAARAAGLLKPRAVAPMHWGTFPPLVQTADGFASVMAETQPDIRVLRMLPGQRVSLD